jgi:hypothetical protein
VVFAEELLALFYDDDDANDCEQIFHATAPCGWLIPDEASMREQRDKTRRDWMIRRRVIDCCAQRALPLQEPVH